MVSHLFGGRDLLESKLTILVFYITKEPVDRYPLPTLWNWIVRLEGMEGISLEECRDRMVVYDPLCQDDQDKTSLTALLRKVTPVGENAFQTSLSTSTELRHVVKIKNGRSFNTHRCSRIYLAKTTIWLCFRIERGADSLGRLVKL
jgi:hypothetical protein